MFDTHKTTQKVEGVYKHVKNWKRKTIYGDDIIGVPVAIDLYVTPTENYFHVWQLGKEKLNVEAFEKYTNSMEEAIEVFGNRCAYVSKRVEGSGENETEED